METTIQFTRVNNDINGNPRYVCHFSNLLNESDKVNRPPSISSYDIAIKKAKKIGGKKFRNKQYGGGIVFQSYSLHELERLINEVANS